jgi:TonB family protein
MTPRLLVLTVALLAAPVATAQEVVKGGEDLFHLTPLDYPSDLREAGIQGTVVVDTWLDAKGHVLDARIVSGPMELRRLVLGASLGFHFAPGGSATRQLAIEYKLPMDGGPNPKGLYKPGPRPNGLSARELRSGVVKTIDMDGLTERLKQELRSRMPIQPGARVERADWVSIQRAIADIDEHLDLQLAVLPPASNPPALSLRIFHPRDHDLPPPPPPPPPPIRKR